jgi:hypothetical protein
VTATWPLFWLLAQAAATPPGAPAPDAVAAPPAAAAAPAPAPAPRPSPAAPQPQGLPPPRLPPSMATPFRLSLTYVHVLREDGELSTPGMNTNAVGIDMAFPSNSYVRNHLGLAHQWESVGPYSARGFRIDLVSLGYPIPLLESPTVRLDLEPIVTILRGELMFVNGGGRVFRMESGFSLELSAAVRRWFLAVSAGIDFRYWVYTSGGSTTGFTRVVPLRFAIGREF